MLAEDETLVRMTYPAPKLLAKPGICSLRVGAGLSRPHPVWSKELCAGGADGGDRAEVGRQHGVRHGLACLRRKRARKKPRFGKISTCLSGKLVQLLG
jgi:hypothetical protein